MVKKSRAENMDVNDLLMPTALHMARVRGTFCDDFAVLFVKEFLEGTQTQVNHSLINPVSSI